MPPWERAWYRHIVIIPEDWNRETARDNCLKRTNWEGEQISLLEQRIEIKLSKQNKKLPPNNRIIHFWTVTADVDPEDWCGHIWGESDEHILEGLGELEERSV